MSYEMHVKLRDAINEAGGSAGWPGGEPIDICATPEQILIAVRQVAMERLSWKEAMALHRKFMLERLPAEAYDDPRIIEEGTKAHACNFLRWWLTHPLLHTLGLELPTEGCEHTDSDYRWDETMQMFSCNKCGFKWCPEDMREKETTS